MDLWSAIFTVIRRWYVSLPILAVAVVAMFAIGGGIKPDYEAKASIVLNPPARKIVSGQEQTFRNQYAEDTQTLSAAVYRQINSIDQQRRLSDDGFSPRYEVELDQFSAIMDFTVTGSSPEQALDTANQLINETERTALAIQRQSQPPEDELVRVDPVSLPVDAELVPGSKTRVMATILLLGLVGAASAAFMVESLANRRRQGPAGAPYLDPAYAAYAGYPQLPPGAYPAPAPLVAYPGYAPVVPVPPAQPTTAPAATPTPAPAYAGANGYAVPAPMAEEDPDAHALDSLLADVDGDEQRAPTRPPEGRIINRGRAAGRRGPAEGLRDDGRKAAGGGDPERNEPVLVGRGDADEPLPRPSSRPVADADTDAHHRAEVEVEGEGESLVAGDGVPADGDAPTDEWDPTPATDDWAAAGADTDAAEGETDVVASERALGGWRDDPADDPMDEPIDEPVEDRFDEAAEPATIDGWSGAESADVREMGTEPDTDAALPDAEAPADADHAHDDAHDDAHAVPSDPEVPAAADGVADRPDVADLMAEVAEGAADAVGGPGVVATEEDRDAGPPPDVAADAADAAAVHDAGAADRQADLAEHGDRPTDPPAADTLDAARADLPESAATEPVDRDAAADVPDPLEPDPVASFARAEPSDGDGNSEGTPSSSQAVPQEGPATVGAPPATVFRSEVPERRRPAGAGGGKDRARNQGGRNGGASGRGSGRGGGGGQGGGGGDRSGTVRNGGNSRSASRRNRRSLFAQPPVPVEGGPAVAPTPGVTKEPPAPDGQ